MTGMLGDQAILSLQTNLHGEQDYEQKFTW